MKNNYSQQNAQLATDVLKQLLLQGVSEFCVCPGARNAPLIATLTENPSLFKTYYFFEERCAAFFALGRMRQTGKPVAVITTSGTAVGELLPATMEADYSGLPLILLTADRPRRYRGSGAPQAAEQVGIFGVYASQTIDLEGEERREILITGRPLHINLCLEEPLLEAPGLESAYRIEATPLGIRNPTPLHSRLVPEIKKFLDQVRFPLVIVGGLHPHERESVIRLLMRWNVPVYLEGLSGIREDTRLSGQRIHIADRIFERAFRADFKVDGVVRIGGVPTLRLWRDLDMKYSSMPVLSLSSLRFSGLGRPSDLWMGNLPELCQALERQLDSRQQVDSSRWIELDRKAAAALRELLASEPESEPGMMAALSARLPKKSRVYLGNSMPIREWDLAALPEDLEDVWGSRGLNGIDGQVSTFLGFSKTNAENWAILGDLTALYDLPGPWILSQLQKTHVNLIIINNGGGKIFSRMFTQPEFQNNHQIHFHSWAELWGIRYEKWMRVPSEIQNTVESRIIEAIPSEEATERFWKCYSKLELIS